MDLSPDLQRAVDCAHVVAYLRRQGLTAVEAATASEGFRRQVWHHVRGMAVAFDPSPSSELWAECVGMLDDERIVEAYDDAQDVAEALAAAGMA